MALYHRPLSSPLVRVKFCHLKLWRKLTRSLYSKTGKWVDEFSLETREELEAFWKDKLQTYSKELTLNKQDERPKYYVLSMFPYPSGRLHMGHVRVYTISDTFAHFHRLNGKQVLHPMGWDAFGLPAENAAIERKLKPDDWTYSNIEYMKKQLTDLSMCFNWDREVTTCNPDYYRWTQSIFVKLYRAGLAYQKEALVNWDPVDQTVLAKEQVDENGCSWRSGAIVEQKLLKQWFLKMTHYSKSLLDGLEDLPHWPAGVKSMQANWIGDCSGCAFNFTLQDSTQHVNTDLPIHTAHPELIYGASHIVLAPTHILLKKKEFLNRLSPAVRVQLKQIESTELDINLGISAFHPLTQKSIPVFASSRLPFQENVESSLGIPCFCWEDREFAELHGVSFETVIDRGSGEARLMNSDKFTGLTVDEAKAAVMQHARDLNVGGHMTSPRQFDWLISRQRYWGTPIPIINCDQCGAVPVPEGDLPVVLPKLNTLTGKGMSPLAEATDWVNVRCPECSGDAKRETDTMDTFVDSSWYFLRYTDAANEKAAFGQEAADWLMPVDLYIGGKEHAIMHLLYARFINHFLHDQGLVAHKEPFACLLTQGLVMGQSYRVASTGQYIRPQEVEFKGEEPVQKDTDEKLIAKWEKMSKSKHNGVDPEETAKQYGIDTVRLFILSGIPPEHDMPWNISTISGVMRWKNRLWSLVTRFIRLRNQREWSQEVPEVKRKKHETKLGKLRNTAIQEVTEQFTTDYMPSVAITRLMELTNTLRGFPDDVVRNSRAFEDTVCALCIMTAPMAPMITSELWRGIAGAPYHLTGYHWDRNVLQQSWPTLEPESQEKAAFVNVTVKVNNQTKGEVRVRSELLQNEHELKRLILDSDLGQEVVGQSSIKRIIVAAKVPLVNFVLEAPR
ncbi:probable leucine--tRNA ligase, mitochondrial [Patiria miniata]|uniref:leucine--tRNA ligase n=1 Tax=Patiria miniata TaxID=46514 RepID=A0A914AR16_PATMI|nr:probable leucine--tRNA ligase, mitochondrial [Patiria miniata]